MIAKGNLHSHGTKLAAYLVAAKDGEQAELVELRGFAADNIRDAFIDVQIQAEGTRATKPFFHAYVRLPDGEALRREQWQEIADRIEHRLGFDGQPRAMAFHHGADDSHLHIAWSRIDVTTMRAIDPGLYKNKLREICRELEQELDLTQVRNERLADDRTKSAGRNEFEQSRRLGTDLKTIRTSIRECWERADNGQAFVAALAERGFILARGDRRDFVVVDRAGGDHALGKRITGATAAETRARLADLDRPRLPGVAAAKERQLERGQAAARAAGSAIGIAGQGSKAVEDISTLTLQEQVALQEQQLALMEAARDARLAFLQDEQRKNTAALAVEEERKRQTERATGANADIADPQLRWAKACAAEYDARHPYSSLGKAVGAEYEAFAARQAEWRSLEQKAATPEQRQTAKLGRQIEAADYMAITSGRLKGMSQVTSGMNGPEATRHGELQAHYQAQAVELRQLREDLKLGNIQAQDLDRVMAENVTLNRQAPRGKSDERIESDRQTERAMRTGPVTPDQTMTADQPLDDRARRGGHNATVTDIKTAQERNWAAAAVSADAVVAGRPDDATGRRAEPSPAEPRRTEPSQAAPRQTEPVKAESRQPGDIKPEPGRYDELKRDHARIAHNERAQGITRPGEDGNRQGAAAPQRLSLTEQRAQIAKELGEQQAQTHGLTQGKGKGGGRGGGRR